MKLNDAARSTLQAAGVSQARWARVTFKSIHWFGDACGCTDDRCIGYHHEAQDDCQCLPVLLQDYLTELRRTPEEG